MKVAKYSVRIRGLKVVPGRPFGFVELVGGGSDAFIRPSLMWECERRLPSYAVIINTDKGRRVERFSEKPYNEFIWEGKPDEDRVNTLAPEIARLWADLREKDPEMFGDVSAQECGNTEFNALWSCGTSARDFFSSWQKGFLLNAKKREIRSRFKRLFAEWKQHASGLEMCAKAQRQKLLEGAQRGQDGRPNKVDCLHLPWWYKYLEAGSRAQVLAITKPWSDETNRLVVGTLAATEAAIEAAKKADWNQQEEVWRQIIAKSGLDVQMKRVSGCLGLTYRGSTHCVNYFNREFLFSEWLRSLGERRAALLTLGHTSEEAEAMMIAEDDKARANTLFAQAKAAGLVNEYGSVISGHGHCTIDGVTVTRSHFDCRTDSDNLSREEREKYEAWGISNEVTGWDRREIVSASAVELEHLIMSADLKAVKADHHRYEPITEAGKAEKAKLVVENQERLAEAKAEELRQCGIREEEVRIAAQNAEEERRLRNIALVRKNWRTMLSWTPHSGSYRGLHAEAKVMLERIRCAHTTAQKLFHLNGGEVRLAEEAARKKQTEKDKFLGQANVWDALNGLKL